MSPSVSSPLDRSSSAFAESVATSNECLSWIEPDVQGERKGASIDVVSFVQDLARTSSAGQVAKRAAIEDLEAGPASTSLGISAAALAATTDCAETEQGHCEFPLPMYLLELDAMDEASTGARSLAVSPEAPFSSEEQRRCEFPLPLYTIEL